MILKNLNGQRNGKLVVINDLLGRDKDGQLLIECKCDCGNTVITLRQTFMSGFIKQCGCEKKVKKYDVVEYLDEHYMEPTKKDKLREAEKSIRDYMTGLRAGRYNSKQWISPGKYNLD